MGGRPGHPALPARVRARDWCHHGGGRYRVGDITFHAPIRHDHPGETYGFVFESPTARWSYVADTRYFPELAEHYRAEVVVMNVVLLDKMDIYHLSLPDAKRLIEDMRPKTAVLTHFGMTMWQANPADLAARLSDETGVQVIAARDGMQFAAAPAGGGPGMRPYLPLLREIPYPDSPYAAFTRLADRPGSDPPGERRRGRGPRPLVLRGV